MARLLAFVSVSVLVGLFAIPAAFAGESGVDTRVTGYGGTAGKVQERINRKQTSGALAATARTGSLPFTGVDLAVIAAGSLTLMGAGFVLRRRNRPKTE